jgi:hypothetical protein
MAGRDRVSLLAPMCHDLFHATDPIDCDKRRHERQILAVFQSGYVLDGVVAWGMASDRLLAVRSAVSRRISAAYLIDVGPTNIRIHGFHSCEQTRACNPLRLDVRYGRFGNGYLRRSRLPPFQQPAQQ